MAVTILVIDDSEVAASAISEILTEAGFHVDSLHTPIGVTRRLLAGDVAAVIVDLMMPALRGDRLIALVRKRSQLADLPMILTSGNDLLEDDEKPPDDVEFLPKSELRHALVPTLKRMLAARSKR